MPFPSQPSWLRRGRPKIVAAATALSLLVAAFALSQAPVQAALQPASVPDRPSATHKVTLVTGDIVTVTTMADGRQIADVDRPADAVGGVRMQEIQGDLYVLPDEAISLFSAGLLDRRLFNEIGRAHV